MKTKRVDRSKWWNQTWNVVTGCDPCSPGCANCWARAMSKRFGKDGFNVKVHTDRYYDPMRWKRPCVVFVNNMGDLWHPAVNPLVRSIVLSRVADLQQHTFVFLTKRSDRLRDDLTNNTMLMQWRDKVPNAYMGITVCDHEEASEKMPHLLACAGWNLWVNVEPMLADILFWKSDLKRLRGLICGAETGPGKRVMDKEWGRSMRDQCQDAGIPFFFKRDSQGHHSLDGKVHEETPWGDQIEA